MQNSTKKMLTKKSNYVIWFLYLVMIAFFLLPILCIVSVSIKNPAEIFGNPHLIPDEPTLDNYKYVFQNTRMPQYILNSFKLVIITVIGTLIVASMAAYGLSRFRFRHKNILLVIILMFQMISAVVLCIPLFQFFSKMGIMNNYAALGFVYIATQLPFATYLLKGVFDAVPREMDESASMDGASRWTILSRIIIPCSRSGISSAIIFIAINAWSQFLIPFILLNKDRLQPIAVGILTVQANFRDITIQYIAAASVIGLLPAILLVIFLQRFIITAMMSGAVKG